MSRFLLGRVAPIAFVAFVVAACGGSTEKKPPAVDAALLKSRLEQIVQTLSNQPDSQVKVTVTGAVTVDTKEDGTVTGTTPKLSIKGADGETVDFDPVTLIFKAGDNADTIPFEIKVPSSVTGKDKDGKVTATFTIGSQNLKGVWREDLQTVDKLDLRLGSISIEPKDEEGRAKIAEISATGGIEDKGSGLYDARYEGKLAGFELDDPKEKTVMKFETIGFKGAMVGAKLKEWGAAAKAAGYTLSNPDIFKMWTQGTFDEKTMAFLRRMPEFMGAIDYSYGARGISMKTDGKDIFKLGKADFGIGFAPESADKAKGSVRANFGEIVVDDGSGKPMLPPEADVKDSGFDLEVSGLPSKELWGIYVDLLPSLQKASVASAGGDTSAGEAAMNKATEEGTAKFYEALQKANLGLVLKSISLVTPTLVMNGNGQGTYSPAADLTPVGKVKLTFKGVEDLIAAMEKRGKDDEMAQQIVGALAGLKAFAKPDPATPGVLIIELEGTKDGKMLVNGKDLAGG